MASIAATASAWVTVGLASGMVMLVFLSLEFLNRLVENRLDLEELKDFEGISICRCELGIQVFCGIGKLAVAAGQTLNVIPRNCQEFPLELNFSYRGTSFYQLKSAAALNALKSAYSLSKDKF